MRPSAPQHLLPSMVSDFVPVRAFFYGVCWFFFFFFLNTGFSLLYMTKFFMYENSSQSMMFYLVWQILLFYYSLDGVNYSNMLTISCLPSQFLFLLCLPSYSLKAKVDCAEDIQ